jgi:uncharacterized protein
VVVTVNALSDYSTHSSSIESVATRWFNNWGIGDKESNLGILLLVAKKNRKARIELGKGWGMAWNQHAKKIMDYEIVANFKREEYSKGIREGVEQLSEMAKDGPKNSPSLSYSLLNGTIFTSPLRPRQLGLAILVGFALLGLSFFAKAHQKELIAVGIGIIAIGILGVGGLIIWSVLLALVKGKITVTASSNPESDSSSDGGFGSGRSDGSGGSTGKW